jgi:hypothetical protein
MRGLHVTGFTYRDEEDYAQVLRLEREAQDLGYAVLT